MKYLELPLELPLYEPLPSEEEQPKTKKSPEFEVDYTVKVFEITYNN